MALGKHKTSGGCSYINTLENIGIKVLEKMLIATVKVRRSEQIQWQLSQSSDYCSCLKMSLVETW